ncbi:hypothetical protein OKW49_003716 [Paraburkholderia youngii]|uniref:hypothetical protein n=1 Tax=Paraburkholderia youngii TaxID=2782701 RepID=UPI003D25F874
MTFRSRCVPLLWMGVALNLAHPNERGSFNQFMASLLRDPDNPPRRFGSRTILAKHCTFQVLSAVV